MPHKHSKKAKEKAKMAKFTRIPYNISEPLSAEKSAKLMSKRGKDQFLKEGTIIEGPDGQLNFAPTNEHGIKDPYGQTMLHLAANGNKEMFFLFVIKGVENKNPKDDEGSTPLHSAASNGNLRICELIIETIWTSNKHHESTKIG